jgi:osmotically-inducible protein OsmY
MNVKKYNIILLNKSIIKRFDFKLIQFLFLVVFLTGCDPASVMIGGGIIGSGAVTRASRDQNGIGGSMADSNLQIRINNKLLSEDKNIFDRVELCVKHSNVIVIGYMKNKEQCEKAIRLVKSTTGWHNVYDETRIAERPCDFPQDTSITSSVKSSLTFDDDVFSMNYEVTTVDGVVYICGTAQTKHEKEVVLSCASGISGVKRVVSYILLRKNRIN